MAEGRPAELAAIPDARRLAVPVALGIAGLAWAALWWWSLQASGHVHGASSGGAEGFERLAVLMGWWLVMVAAMMLPLAGQLLDSVAGLARRDDRGASAVAVCGLAFVGMWLVAGLALLAVDRGAGAAVEQLAWLGSHPTAVPGALLLCVGAYQFTPAKRRQLMTCRSSSRLAATRWRDDRPAESAVRVGGSYGAACVGTCGGLMAIMFAATSFGVVIMAPLAAIMAIERFTPWGFGFARAVGGGLVALGLTLLAVAML